MPGVLGSCRSMLRIGRKAASVLPVAVGEIKRTFLPSRILGMVFAWGSVGFRESLLFDEPSHWLYKQFKSVFRRGLHYKWTSTL